MIQQITGSILALDVGEKRIGVALANPIARIASPLTTLMAGDDLYLTIDKLVKQHDIVTIVVGLPRNLNGDDTQQTKLVRVFADELKNKTTAAIVFQDEALTSRQAEDELRRRDKPFQKADIDALAATYILTDYLENNHG